LQVFIFEALNVSRSSNMQADANSPLLLLLIYRLGTCKHEL